MPAKITLTFTGASLRYDDLPIVNGTWSANVDTTQLPNSTAQAPTVMSAVPTDDAGNVGATVTRAMIVANATYPGVVPPVTDVRYWNPRYNSVLSASSAGLRVAWGGAAVAPANVDVDNYRPEQGGLIHVTAGVRYDISAIFELSAAAAASRVMRLGLEWVKMGTGPDGGGGASAGSVTGDKTYQDVTVAPGARGTSSLPGVTAPPEAARLRIIMRGTAMGDGESYLIPVRPIVTPSGAGDTSPPVAAFTSPAAGATVSGITPVSGTYAD